MLNQIGIIGNKYYSAIQDAVERPQTFVRGTFTLKEFESAVSGLIKHQYLDVVVFDISVMKNDNEILEAVRYLKMCLSSSVRLIIFYPGLKDEAVLQQLLVYGVFDIVDTNIDEESMDDITIRNKVVADVRWAISEPTTFAKVADKLAISVITQNVIEDTQALQTPPKPNKEKKQAIKPRFLGLYGEENREVFSALINSGKYTITDLLSADTEAVLDNLELDHLDVIALNDVNADIVSYLTSLLEVNKRQASVIAGYTIQEKYEEAIEIKGAKVFYYDGAPKTFARQVSIKSVAKTEAPKPNSKVYAFYGVKGGVGSTTITVALAQEYAKRHSNEKVLVIDFSTKAGDVGEKFGIDKATPNLFEYVSALAGAKREYIDLNLVKNKIVKYCHIDKKSKVYVLPTSYTDIYRYTDYQYETKEIAGLYKFILDAAKENFDAIFLDVTKFGGYPYDIALAASDKFILVADGKLSATMHLLNEYENHRENAGDKLYVFVNKSNTLKNEKEYENAQILERKIEKNKLAYLPNDKKLYLESAEMDLKYTSKYKAKLLEAFALLTGHSKAKKGLFR